MSNLTVSAPEGSKIPPIEPGTYPAVCVSIIDIGEQYNEQFDNNTRKVIFQWEIPTEKILVEGEEKPRMISETYTASIGEKATLRKTLESWRGRPFSPDELKGFDLENVLGAPCLITILHKENSKGNTFAKISAVTRLPKGYTVEPAETSYTLFSLDDTDAMEKMAALPEWIQNRIKESTTYKARAENFTDLDNEDLPF